MVNSNPNSSSSLGDASNNIDNAVPLVSQGKPEFRKGWPEWIRQLPRRMQPINESFQLINEKELRDLFEVNGVRNTIVEEILDEMKKIEKEIMTLFRERDYKASQYQNDYRSTQLFYMLLATGATIVGSMQALAFGSNPRLEPYLAFVQTIIAALATFVATIGSSTSLGDWMEQRRRAEFLRREYFRYLINLTPYDQNSRLPHEIRQVLSNRAAEIFGGTFPTEEQ